MNGEMNSALDADELLRIRIQRSSDAAHLFHSPHRGKINAAFAQGSLDIPPARSHIGDILIPEPLYAARSFKSFQVMEGTDA